MLTPRTSTPVPSKDQHENTQEISDGGSAFPNPEQRDSDGNGVFAAEPGMSLRDYFAAQAMLGILSGPASRDGCSRSEWFDIPADAYKLADAMIYARTAHLKAQASQPGGEEKE